MNIIHLAIASTTSVPGQIERNLQQITDFARRAGHDGAHLLLTPEMSATGYGNYPEVLELAEIAGQGKVYDTLAKAAGETGVVVCAGFVEQNGDKKHLSHYVIYPDGKFIAQRKHRLTHSEQPLEPVHSQHPPFGSEGLGQAQQVKIEAFTVQGAVCAVAICADNGIKHLDEILAKQRIQVLLAPTGSGGKRPDRVDNAELKTREGREKYAHILEQVFMPANAPLECLENRRALAAVNMCGYDGKNHYHIGHGSITSPMGEVLGFFHGLPNIDRQRPMYAHAEIDLDENVDSCE